MSDDTARPHIFLDQNFCKTRQSKYTRDSRYSVKFVKDKVDDEILIGDPNVMFDLLLTTLAQNLSAQMHFTKYLICSRFGRTVFYHWM